MPGKIKVKVLAGRNLPVMDRASDTTDAFVEIKFGSVTHKTDVCRKSLNPHWSSTEWYRFEVDESELQDEPLQLRLMDHDTYSANDAIGKVVIGLAPLLAREGNKTKNAASQGGALMSGWIPVFDTMHGIRGELNVIVKVELFADFNKYKTSSCGVQFFHCPSIPPGYRATAVHGFVEELVVNDDPEYQWIDKIRTPRASNEARQVAFIKLSNQVQRLVGVKAAELGANAVVGYQQDFDLEGEAGVVARAIGTAVNITPLPTPCQPLNIPPCTQQNDREKEEWEKETGSPQHTRHDSYGGREPISTALQAQNASFNSSSAPLGIQRRSSDSDLSVTPKGGSLNALTSTVGSGGGAILRPSMNSNTLDMLEYPFLTMTEYPPGFIVHLGGTVCSRSVKLIDNDSESTTRAAWWAELRTELRAHARALRCNAVIAYSESAAICEDVCVLSASGTAAMINLDCDFNMELDTSTKEGSKTAIDEAVLEPETCSIAHVPYSPGAGPYRAELSNCGGCKRARVPAVLLATCAKPNRLPAHAKAVTLTAVAARVRRAPPAAEPGARDISDQLPFLEYELHKLLLAKLRMQGANAIFSLQTQISIGERCVMALATGTAFKLTSLPPPTPPRIKASETDKDALEIQRSLWDAFIANKAANGYDIELFEPGNAESPAPNGSLPETFEIEEPPALDLSADKEACVLELDEAEDVETAKSLAMRRMHMQVYTNALKCTPAATPYAFAQVWRARLVLSGQGAGASGAAERHVARALDGVTYKLRRLLPCALVAPRFQLELPEDEIQLVVSGTAVRLVDPNKSEPDSSCTDISSNGHNTPSPPISGGTPPSTGGTPPMPHDNGTVDADDDIFTLDEEQLVKNNQQLEAFDEKNLVVNGQTPTAVSLTTLSSVAGSRAARRICALRLLFVRETTAVRELGGLSGFLHTFTCEVLAIVRAYTAALGGNALTSFYITQLMLQDNAHKNQGQCLLSVGGDVVQIMY
ncbi:C2 domain-containing protein 5 isoform X2 [Hyposmocoma kahamanoa]|uniref:C2 domain-containing protein 5 isoform X2 n=1 Tax=Hyposmocoma kahamanoa TaxID=1477025 RepID=UPI000E6D9D30|nr:C2 domain-containing protein 5 isoform X2 [Hyposmocoma kahamanoa]